MPQFADHFFDGNGWDRMPLDYLDAYVRRLLTDVVAPRGRLIIGAYGSRSRTLPPFDIAGISSGGTPPIASFAWMNAEDHAA